MFGVQRGEGAVMLFLNSTCTRSITNSPCTPPAPCTLDYISHSSVSPICMHMCVHARIREHMRAYVRICAHARQCAHVRAHARICADRRIFAHMQAYARICKHMRAYARIGAHMRPYEPWITKTMVQSFSRIRGPTSPEMTYFL